MVLPRKVPQVLLLALLAGCVSCTGPMRMRCHDPNLVMLDNPYVSVFLDRRTGAVASLRDKTLAMAYRLPGIAFSIETDTGPITVGPPSEVREGRPTTTFVFDAAGHRISLHYRLGPEDRFIEKWVDIRTKNDSPLLVREIVLEDVAPSDPFREIHYHDDQTIWACPINLFLRADKGGCFAGLEYPYWSLEIRGSEGFRLGFAPNCAIAPFETFVSEKYFLGVFQNEGIYRYSHGPYPGMGENKPKHVAFENTGLGQHFKNGVIDTSAVKPEVLDWGEVWAMQEFMRRVLPDDLPLPEDGYWAWVNAWWAQTFDLNEDVIDALEEAGVHDIMTGQVWYGHGMHPNPPPYITNMNTRRDPEFRAPEKFEKIIAYAKERGVHVNSFCVPGTAFKDRPEWLSIDEDGRSSQYLFGRQVSCPACDEYMAFMLELLDSAITRYDARWWGFDGRWMSFWEVPYYRPGEKGLGPDPCYAKSHGHAPGDNLYREWRNIQGFLRELRRRHPRLCLEQYLGLKRGGPWALRYLNADDSYFETNGATMNRFQTWHNQNDRFRPPYKNYAAVFGQNPKEFQFNVLSCISVASYCQIGPGLNQLRVAESREFFSKWRAWAGENLPYLKVKRDLFDCPGFGPLDASAHIINDRGYIFLFRADAGASQGPVRASIPLNRRLGLAHNPKGVFRLTEIHPREMRPLGAYHYGEEFLFDMVTEEPAVVISLEPAEPGEEVPRVELNPDRNVEVVSAFSQAKPDVASLTPGAHDGPAPSISTEGWHGDPNAETGGSR